MADITFTPRLYQQTITHACSLHNCLVVLPTGMGKTNIFLMTAINRLRLYPSSKILLLGPTKPLIDQYKVVFSEHSSLDPSRMAVFTGNMPPEKRAALWSNAQIIFSTPQCIENDVLSNKIRLQDVSLLGIDEAHRAVGNYSYVLIAKLFMERARFPRIVAMTASPGSDLSTVQEVCKNLFIEDIAVRTENDQDMKPYIQDVRIDYVKVDLPQDILDIKKTLQQCHDEKLAEVVRLGYLNKGSYNKTALLEVQRQLHQRMAREEKDFSMLRSISLLAEAMKVQHALELIETQSLPVLLLYFDKLQQEAAASTSKAVQNLVKDPLFLTARARTQAIVDKGIVHPKLPAVLAFLKEQLHPGMKAMLFTQYRDTGSAVVHALSRAGISSKLFVGQAKKNGTGLAQKEQRAMLDAFGEGAFSVLVSSSVGEEGLDIPAVDLVIFYEPIPSVIRKIQRSGRTGRLEKGRVVVFITRNTRDEAYHYVAKHKETKMYRILADLKNTLVVQKPEQTTLSSEVSAGTKPSLLVDSRERNSALLKELSTQMDIDVRRLDCGDYIVGGVVIEYKRVPDFIDSIVDGRLLDQLKSLKQQPKALIILEGDEDLYLLRRIHPHAIQGMLATIAVSYGLPLIRTKNEKETAGILLAIARRDEKKPFAMHITKPLSRREQQEYVVGALPGIGPALAKPLLEHFGSVRHLFSASEEDLRKVHLVGEIKAKNIRDVLDKEYEKKE